MIWMLCDGVLIGVVVGVVGTLKGRIVSALIIAQGRIFLMWAARVTRPSTPPTRHGVHTKQWRQAYSRLDDTQEFKAVTR